jgi:hypothetical protein
LIEPTSVHEAIRQSTAGDGTSCDDDFSNATGRGDVGRALGQCGECVAVAFEGGAFVVGEGEAFEHLVDAVSDSSSRPALESFGRWKGQRAPVGKTLLPPQNAEAEQPILKQMAQVLFGRVGVPGDQVEQRSARRSKNAASRWRLVRFYERSGAAEEVAGGG